MAFWRRELYGTFEKRAPGQSDNQASINAATLAANSGDLKGLRLSILSYFYHRQNNLIV